MKQRMKRKSRESGIFKRFAAVSAVCLLALGLARPAFADVPPPPPSAPAAEIRTIAAAPNGVRIEGTFRTANGHTVVPHFRGGGPTPTSRHFTEVKPTPVAQQAGQVLRDALKTNPVTFRDSHGATARGQIKTASRLPSSNVMAKAGAGLAAGQVFGGALSHQGQAIGSAIAQGDYTAAGQAAVLGTLQSLRSMGDTVLGGLISGAEGTYAAYNAHNNPDTVAGQIYEAAQRKAEETARRYQEQYEQTNQFRDYLPAANGIPKAYPKLLIVINGPLQGTYILPPNAFSSSGGYRGQIKIPVQGGSDFVIGQPCQGYGCMTYSYKTEQTTPQNYQQYVPDSLDAVHNAGTKPTAEDYLLTQIEMQQIISRQLERLLNDNNRNAAAIINALVAGGALKPADLPTTVTGGDAANTFLTEPYTPAGSQTAQQTQFVVKADGSVEVRTIPRPDLAPNTSQAPPRQEIANPQHPETRPQKENSTPEKPDICAQNPNSIMCAETGSADYPDLILPVDARNVEFAPQDLFGSNGICPAPKQVQFLTIRLTIPYEPICDFALKLRPLVILLGMMTAMFIVWRCGNG